MKLFNWFKKRNDASVEELSAEDKLLRKLSTMDLSWSLCPGYDHKFEASFQTKKTSNDNPQYGKITMFFEDYDRELSYEIRICDLVFAKFSVPTKSKWASVLYAQAMKQVQAKQEKEKRHQRSVLDKQCRNILELLP